MTSSQKTTIPVVGLGASAGGLEALKDFFNTMPDDSNMAFVVITHHHPEHISLLPEILSHHTAMPVIPVHDATNIMPNHVYVCSSGNVYLSGGKFHCEEANPQPGIIPLPIDFFFRSLATELKEKAIGIILSGAGSDGTLGLQAIKGEAGMVMAQEPGTAQFSTMPYSAINTGIVDYILPPEKMPEQLISYVKNIPNMEKTDTIVQLSDTLGEILSILRRHTGNDFSHYKTNTLLRRIERRMNIHHITDSRHYIRYLTESSHEIDLLFRELLIGVTCFFRDPAAFDALATETIPHILAEKAEGDEVRIWVAGCSTGEEAYSLAILFQEYMVQHKKHFNVQIFATDLDAKAISFARNAMYAAGIALDVTHSRLLQHFNFEDNHYQIKKHLREMVIFAVQNVTQDPPFTKLDMVSCRNLLIYLDSKLQKRIIPLFHYSLKPKGILFLGSSESIGTFTDLFTPMQSRWKILMRREVPISMNRFTRFTEFPRLDEIHTLPTSGTTPKEKPLDITELAQKLLLKAHIPPSVIVNEKGNLFFIHGRTGLYLELPPAPPTTTTKRIGYGSGRIAIGTCSDYPESCSAGYTRHPL